MIGFSISSTGTVIAEQLVAPIARRDRDHPADIGSAGDIVDPGAGHLPVPVGGDEPIDHRIVHLGDLGQHRHGRAVGTHRFR